MELIELEGEERGGRGDAFFFVPGFLRDNILNRLIPGPNRNRGPRRRLPPQRSREEVQMRVFSVRVDTWISYLSLTHLYLMFLFFFVFCGIFSSVPTQKKSSKSP